MAIKQINKISVDWYYFILYIMSRLKKRRKMKKVTFTIYFPFKDIFERYLDKENINFETEETAFIQWYYIEEKYKGKVNEIITENNFQDGMADEFKWNGWTSWSSVKFDYEKIKRSHL